ncbi:testicular acid phosphatase homolog [Corticium candelabrum]|uniref:testicular acid phosphatase homolog n=1 Tax=Corticium candelabrum TaxID=121492 RepID=UPI002E254A41|nr:testicular acid phosphatase homolog [Corticium candelabrum]
MVQQYELGTHLRKRYTTENSETYLFHRSYSKNEVYVQSTDVDRTLMSAECQMAAFYHPNGSQVFLKYLKWQPVPIHTVPKDEDNVLHAFTADCPIYKQFENNLINDPDWVQKRKKKISGFLIT